MLDKPDTNNLFVFDSKEYMDTARTYLPTIVEQWDQNYDQIDNMISSNNFMQIPLFKRLSDMDSNYSQLIYVAVGRKRNSNTWQFNQEDEKIPGFIEFYD